ncbi:MAG: hypothetical protein HKN09_00430 [Saprospiraceae bacterium]|nr:hypothetical protein [Saprospiraceae bacterium]
MRATLLLSCLAMLIWSCEESRTACLDFAAENYDVGAVNACDSCCTYPSFSLNTSIIFDTFDFSYNRYTLLPSGDSIAIQSFELGIFDIKLENADTSYYVLNFATADSTLRDNSILYNSRASSSLSVGETNFSDDVSSISFTLGVDQGSLPDLDNVLSSSNWNVLKDSLYIDAIPVFNTFKMTYLLNDSIQHLISSDRQLDNLSSNIIKFVPPGQDWNLEMVFDFNLLLNGVNGSLTDEEIKALIEDNLSSLIQFN